MCMSFFIRFSIYFCKFLNLLKGRNVEVHDLDSSSLPGSREDNEVLLKPLNFN